MSLSKAKRECVLNLVNKYLERPLAKLLTPEYVDPFMRNKTFMDKVKEDYDIIHFKQDLIQERITTAQQIQDRLCLLANILLTRSEFLFNPDKVRSEVSQQRLDSAIIASSPNKTRKLEYAVFRDLMATRKDERFSRFVQLETNVNCLSEFIDHLAAPIYDQVLSISDETFAQIHSFGKIQQLGQQLGQLYNNPPPSLASDYVSSSTTTDNDNTDSTFTPSESSSDSDIEPSESDDHYVSECLSPTDRKSVV